MPGDVAVVVGTAVVGASAADNAVRFVLGSPDRKLIGNALKTRQPATARVHPSQLTTHDGPIAELDSWDVLWQLRRALAYRDPNSARAFCDRLYSLSSASSAAHSEDALLELAYVRARAHSEDALLELAYVRARISELDVAESLIADACSFGVVSPAREHRARAALLLAHGDMVGARDAATLGLDELTLDGGDTLLERELLLEIRVAASDADFAAAWLRWEKF
jgi:hypothetical protein